MAMEFVELTCPNCGGHLSQIGKSNRWKCAHCGTERVLQQIIIPQESNPTPQEKLSALRKEVRMIQMDIVLAVGEFTSRYPDWEVSQWVQAEKGEGGEVGAYRGKFLEQLTRKLIAEVSDKKSGISAQSQSAKDGTVLVEKLLNWRNDIAVKKRAIQALKKAL